MQTRLLHIFPILFAFVLYTIPLCQCAEMMKAKAAPSCCSASSLTESGAHKACTDATECCADGINAEKMKTEKSFESAQVSLSSPALVSVIEFPSLFASTQSISFNNAFSVHSPPTQAFLQVFLI
ncbi:MAG: hypothetical protein SNJ66_10100 [Chloroherpetonaceae bacterium]